MTSHPPPVRVTSVDHLRALIADGTHEYRLLLQFGLFSRKNITLQRDGRFCVVNHIDESRQTLTEAELHTESNIGEAIDKGALIAVS